MLAILEDALECYTKHRQLALVLGVPVKHPKLYREARAWLLGDAPAYVTLEMCCDGLALEAEDIRRRVRQLEVSDDRERALRTGTDETGAIS